MASQQEAQDMDKLKRHVGKLVSDANAQYSRWSETRTDVTKHSSKASVTSGSVHHQK